MKISSTASLQEFWLLVVCYHGRFSLQLGALLFLQFWGVLGSQRRELCKSQGGEARERSLGQKRFCLMSFRWSRTGIAHSGEQSGRLMGTWNPMGHGKGHRSFSSCWSGRSGIQALCLDQQGLPYTTTTIQGMLTCENEAYLPWFFSSVNKIFWFKTSAMLWDQWICLPSHWRS